MTRWPFRVTSPLVDVVDALASTSEKIHGWALAEMCGQTPPNTYRALERLLNADWVAYKWELENPKANRPRRRLYWLTEEGWRYAPALVAERRGERVRQRSSTPVRPLLGNPCGDV